MIGIIKKCIPFVFIVLTNLVPFLIKCQYICENNGNYTANSTYRANLKTLLSSLHSNVPDCGFHNASAGQSPDIVNAIVLCRGDVELRTCQSCVYNTTIDIIKFCPHEKEAYLWRELCMLHYSNEPMFGTLWNYPNWCTCNATGRDHDFKAVLKALDRLGLQAASRRSVKKIAAGKLTLPENQTIYALVQCTPDLSQPDCNTCLRNAVQDIPRCCNWRRGAVAIFRPSCTLRYETFQFYNPSMLQGSFSPLPPEFGQSLSIVTNENYVRASKDKNDSTQLVIIIVGPVAGCLALAFVTCTFLRRRMKQKPKQNLEMITAEWLQYDFSIIRDATNDFSEANKLGQGGFGAVYKGELVSGQEVAVKRLSKSSEQGDEEFKNEASLLARLQHRNLVRLLGFCLTQTERILVYEFVQNASLDNFIFDPIRRQKIGWDIRHKIIRGITKGLVYLHEDSRLTIIHRDLKVGNVLLDGDMNPKIADFGMARLVGQDETHGRTDRIVGTRGYMSPEYAYKGHFCVKSDVFSFGVIVLEIVSGQKNNNFRDEDQNEGHLLSYAWRNWHEGNAENVVDPALRDSSGFRDDILRCVHIGLLCVQENADDRPTMASVALMLNSSSLPLSVPSKPGFFIPGRLDRDIEMKPSNESGQPTLSTNGISMTEMYPR